MQAIKHSELKAKYDNSLSIIVNSHSVIASFMPRLESACLKKHFVVVMLYTALTSIKMAVEIAIITPRRFAKLLTLNSKFSTAGLLDLIYTYLHFFL
ncbi:MAG: hypothetical protein LBD84_05635 [Campylobacteraceae bacterium]|nr:hypothetical protein [Campylobacteraceae bacterium]